MKTKKLPQAIAALKKYKEQNNLSFHELEKQTGVASATLNGWCTGRIVPLHSSLEKIKLFLDRQYSSEFTKQFSSNVDYIDSRLIARWIGRHHKYLLADIRNHIEHLELLDKEFRGGKGIVTPHQKADITSPYSTELYFVKASYIHPQNKTKYPYYLVTQLGCDLIRNRLKGVKGTQFTALYINEFHRLRNEVEAIPAPQEAPQIEQDTLFDHEPQTPEERDLLYLKQRLLEDTKDARTIVSFAVGISKTWKVLKAIKDAKHITDYN